MSTLLAMLTDSNTLIMETIADKQALVPSQAVELYVQQNQLNTQHNDSRVHPCTFR